MVVDIGAALDVLGKTLEPLGYQNLDVLPQFKGQLTTTEFLCKYVFDRIAKAAASGALGGRREDTVAHPRDLVGNRLGASKLRGTDRWLMRSSQYPVS